MLVYIYLPSNSSLSSSYFFITLISTLIFRAQTWLDTEISTYLKTKEIKVPKTQMDFIPMVLPPLKQLLKKTSGWWLENLLWKKFANSRETKIISKGRRTPIDFLHFECRAHYQPCCRTLFYSDVRVLWDIKSGILFLSLASRVCTVPHKQHNPCETWKQNLHYVHLKRNSSLVGSLLFVQAFKRERQHSDFILFLIYAVLPHQTLQKIETVF